MRRCKTFTRGVLASFLLLPWLAAPTFAAGGGDHWLRHPAISPDGQTVALAWRGDLWTVGVAGGEAERLTSHADYEAWPVWSPDSKTVAFASDRHGQLDVFVIAAAGGPATRLTYHSSDDHPATFSPDGSRLFFSANRQHAPQALLGSGRRFEELYSIAVAGGAPRQELTTMAEDARLSADGRYLLYEEVRAYENEWRKHHTTSASRDLWSYDFETGAHAQLTDFAGEDRKPVWLPGGAFAFLSERDGNLDVYRQGIVDGRPAGEAQQLTDHGPHPVRYLTGADDGTLAYAYDGSLYVLSPGGEPRRLEIGLTTDERDNGVFRETHRDGASEMAVSPHGDEVAFVIRGEIFVASADHGTTRRLTETPEQERSLTWAPDGRTLYYASERDEAWNLYALTLADEDEQRFFEATAFTESTVLEGEDETFQPVMSPDGERLAFLHNRDEIRLLELATGEQTTVIPKERNYSYADGDIEYVFSPDGLWLAATYIPFERWISEVALVELATGEVTNASLSGYNEGAPRFTRDGKSLLFLSNRQGFRDHAGRATESDVFSLSLNRAAWDEAVLSVEEFERLQAAKKRGRSGPGGGEGEGEDDDDGGDSGDEGTKGGDGPPLRPIDPMTVETDDVEYRTKRLTAFSAEVGDFTASKDGEVVFMIARTEGDFDLWMARPRHGEVKRLAELDDRQPGSLEMSAKGDRLFIGTGSGRILSLEVKGLLRSLERNGGNGGMGGNGGNRGFGRAQPKPVAFSADMSVDRSAEWHHLFEHVWRQVKRKFYREDLHGADWPALKVTYSRFLDDLRHGRDFAEVLSEMLGELNASHTGGRYRSGGEDRDRTASLGLLYDPSEASMLTVAEVLKRGPADRADSRFEPGTVITHIDGVALGEDVNPWSLLDRKAGERVRLRAKSASGEAFEEVIKAIPERRERRLR
ncbi:MAG: hypothetical protein AAGF23_12835, partial [Acidobacteriota bacterium]